MLALHKKVYQYLEHSPMTSEELMKKMPDEKPTSIRAIITLHPELFIRITTGVIGIRGRDEHLAKFYEQTKTKMPTINQIIKCFLATGSKTLQEIYAEFSDIKEESIQRKLTEDEEIACREDRYSLKSK